MSQSSAAVAERPAVPAPPVQQAHVARSACSTSASSTDTRSPARSDLETMYAGVIGDVIADRAIPLDIATEMVQQVMAFMTS